MRFEITNPKHQTLNNIKIPNSKFQTGGRRVVVVWNIGSFEFWICLGFGACDLGFVKRKTVRQHLVPYMIPTVSSVYKNHPLVGGEEIPV